MTSELMLNLNMDGHGDKTDRKGGEKQEKHAQGKNRSVTFMNYIYVKYIFLCVSMHMLNE